MDELIKLDFTIDPTPPSTAAAPDSRAPLEGTTITSPPGLLRPHRSRTVLWTTGHPGRSPGSRTTPCMEFLTSQTAAPDHRSDTLHLHSLRFDYSALELLGGRFHPLVVSLPPHVPIAGLDKEIADRARQLADLAWSPEPRRLLENPLRTGASVTPKQSRAHRGVVYPISRIVYDAISSSNVGRSSREAKRAGGRCSSTGGGGRARLIPSSWSRNFTASVATEAPGKPRHIDAVESGTLRLEPSATSYQGARDRAVVVPLQSVSPDHLHTTQGESGSPLMAIASSF